MTTTDTTNRSTASTAVPPDHDWLEAGDAWGHAAVDWACLYEHYSFEVIGAMFGHLGLGPGVELLDIACGAGLSVRHAASTGAHVAGIDASTPLLEIARNRNPEADLRHGSMFELPWPDDRFDAAVSINGIWGHCDRALAEARRVLRPGAPFGFSFWGLGTPNDLRPCFLAYAQHIPPAPLDGMKRTNNIAKPGVAEEMVEEAGFELVTRRSVISTIEWPDEDTAWRALRSAGPAVPALRAAGEDRVRADVLAAIEHTRDASGMYRFRNVHEFVIARTPA